MCDTNKFQVQVQVQMQSPDKDGAYQTEALIRFNACWALSTDGCMFNDISVVAEITIIPARIRKI